MFMTGATCNTIIQTVVDEEKRSRVMSYYTMFFIGVAPLGHYSAGWLAEHIGAPLTFVAGGVILVKDTCTAAKVGPRHLLLAAHCVARLAVRARVRGDHDRVVAGEEPLLLAPRMRRSVTHEIIRAVSAARPSGNTPLAPSVSIAAQSGGRLVVVTDFLGDAEELLTVASRLVAAGREVHAVHVIAQEEIDPSAAAAMVSDPEAPELRRALTTDTRDSYLAAYGNWRDRIAHEFAEAGVAYATAVVGEETTEHLIRRVTAPRGVAATA